MGNWLISVVIVRGVIVGTWKRVLKKDSVSVVSSPLRKLTIKESKEIEKATDEYGKFLGLKSSLEFSVQQ